jgi:hypothetical protein
VQLKPCLYRQVNDDGLILCGKIKTGDRAVTGDDCQACPIAQIDCSHLRATLLHAGHPPLLVRYGNGKMEVWDDPTPPLAFERAACAAQIQPLHSSHECTGCAQRQALGLPIDNRPLQSATSDRAAVSIAAISAREPRRVRVPAGRTIPREPWRASHPAAPAPSALVGEPIPVAPLPRGQERRVGWAD